MEFDIGTRNPMIKALFIKLAYLEPELFTLHSIKVRSI